MPSKLLHSYLFGALIGTTFIAGLFFPRCIDLLASFITHIFPFVLAPCLQQTPPFWSMLAFASSPPSWLFLTPRWHHLHTWVQVLSVMYHASYKLLHYVPDCYIVHACIASSLTLHHAWYKLLLSWQCWCILRFCISSSWLRALYKLLHSLLDWYIPHSYKSFAIP